MSDSNSKRLDSLSRRAVPAPTSGTAKPGLKFRPKIVARKTKEERDAAAPVIVKEDPTKTRGSLRGRGRGRGRGRANFAGTRLVSSGPLSSGQVLSNAKSGLGTSPDRIFSSSSTPEFISSLKLKSDPSSRDATPDSDDDGDPTKINMNREYRFEDSETYLFPVRPNRADHYEYGDMIVKLETSSAEPVDVKSTTATPDPESIATGSKVKSETEDTPTIPTAPSISNTTSSDPTDENLKSKLDHLQIANLFNSLSVSSIDKEGDVNMIENNQPLSQKYILFQLPKILPDFRSEMGDAVKPEEGEIVSHNEGEIGQLRVHASGKITMAIGNIVMDVGQGANTNFLQDAVVIDLQEEKDAYLLGHVDQKILVTPRFT